ncbi:RDD family protein [Pseudomonas sp. 21LCFQ02]|uniref:RDD family protein n=1 Tax=unclassified Pseudomonas TaxID=196821 RepID=UPI0005ED6BFA|nr:MULTISPECIES: RDD family protein [unclassified Pseudomonas]MCO8166526.1 RDD family protein [Pseudomonas sp. 21LCFQ02]MCQ9422458.1 RDD family protein [Pseudomonas sp. LJDD11]
MFPVSPRQAAPLDTRLGIETPEGIDLLLRPAGLTVRALAFSIDLLLRGLLLLTGYGALSLFGDLGMGLSAIGLFLINWWYPVLFEVLNQGRTPGKQMMALRVIHDDGTPVGWTSSLIRNLLRMVDMLPFGYAAGALACLNHPHFKRLGDLAAATLVVYNEPLRQPPVLPDAPPAIAPFALQLAEQRAILDFAERQGELSDSRTRELAGLLAEPLQVAPGQAASRINGIARGLLGAP